MTFHWPSRALLGACAAALLAACGGSGGGTEGVTPLYAVTVNVSGLSGTFVLQNNGGDNLTVSANGSFPFPTRVANGSAYNVTVFSQPAGYTCTPSGNSGTMPPNGISVTVTCNINTELNVLAFVAGDLGGSGNVDAVGTAARFNSALGVAVDGSGNAFVADTFNHTIRKIASDGTVTTFAGVAGSSGNVDSASGTPRFNNPRGVAVDGSGNVVVADTGNNAIRKITSAGVVSTLIASTDLVAGTSLSGPEGVAIDPSGNIYVGDTVNLRILKIAGTVSVFTTDTYEPSQLATDGTTLYWSGADVSGEASGVLRKMPLAGGPASSLSGVFDPVGVAVVGTDVFFTVLVNHAVWKRDSGGIVSVYAGATGTAGDWVDSSGTNARFNSPWGLAKDGSGNLYVADSSNNAIRKISTTQVVSTIAGAAAQTGNNDGSGAGARFFSPNGLGVDASGVLYVADSANHMIRKVTTAGAVATFAGSGTVGHSDAAPVTFNFPTDVAVDSFGNAYVADSENHLIRKITSSGVVSTFAGTATVSGFSNTAPVTFFGPQGVGLES